MAHRGILCDFCGKSGARLRRVTRSYRRGAEEFLVRNIPTISCPHCGETYLTASTLHELERIKTHRRTLTVRRSFSVAGFPDGTRRRAS